MLNTNLVAPAILRLPSIVEVLHGHDPDRGLRCRIYHTDGWQEAWTWLSVGTSFSGPLRRGVASLLEIGRHPEDAVLLGFCEEADLPLSAVLPNQLCPIDAVVRQTTQLVDALEIASLRRFLTRALLHRDALHGYWTSPASRRHHHAYPGGLAQHSLEVATMVASANGLRGEDRELGIVFALLHDYGKIWCYRPPTHESIPSGQHEAWGLNQLENDLDVLIWEEPTIGAQIRELLGGRRAARATSYPLAIGRIVRSFDEMSCEMTRNKNDGGYSSQK